MVEKLNSETALKNYLKKYNSINLLLQEFIDLKNECGIFYHRIPNNKEGKITSITLKKYLTVLGNGKSTIKQLILTHERARNYIDLIHYYGIFYHKIIFYEVGKIL